MREIGRRLDVSHASVSVWVRDVRLPDPSPASPRPPEPDDQNGAPRRRCGRCERVLPASAFNRHGAGRQWWCRECFRAYFRERGSRHLAQVAASRTRRRAAAHDFIERYLSCHPCSDCGEVDLTVLEFDHRRDKRAAVSTLRYAATGCAALAEEVAKCDVVCANCHRRRTARRAGWLRSHRDWRDRLERFRPETARNLQFVYGVLERSPCIDCGESDMCVLDFDHIGPKRKSVMQLAMHGYGFEKLEDEVSHCEVRCANCHRRRHARAKRGAS